jgi:uncharacterized alpha-E superfamily protein
MLMSNLSPVFSSEPVSQRPLLSRVADSLYWMARYVERTEHVARALRITTNLLMDVGDLPDELHDRQWLSLLTLTGGMPVEDGSGVRERVVRFLALDAANPGSLVSCVSKARENARAVRSEISAEMWETINQQYWSIRTDETRTRLEENPEEFYAGLLNFSMLFQGQSDQTLPHSQRWHFVQLAKSLERVDMTCRVVLARLDAFGEVEASLESPLRTIQWMSTIRMCCGIEAYRRRHMADFDALKVAGFIVLERSFPRSIRYSVDTALDAITQIRKLTSPDSVDPAERVLGRLAANLEYAYLGEIAEDGVREYLLAVQQEIAEASVLVQQTYFLK